VLGPFVLYSTLEIFNLSTFHRLVFCLAHRGTHLYDTLVSV
jgi:hypothetical protein